MKTVPEMLREGADTYEERNKLYGDNYKRHGLVMSALFPNGVQLNTMDDHNRFGILTQKVAKLTRYCQNFTTGGHADSLHDDMVYTAMLAELDGEIVEHYEGDDGTATMEEQQFDSVDVELKPEDFASIGEEVLASEQEPASEPPVVIPEGPTEAEIDEWLAGMKGPGTFYANNRRFKHMEDMTPEQEREFARTSILKARPKTA